MDSFSIISFFTKANDVIPETPANEGSEVVDQTPVNEEKGGTGGAFCVVA
jgi:hypothetical protein